MWTATAVVAGFVLAVLTKPTQAGFDFGAGCEGGGGSFPLNLPSAGEVSAVGPIPAGKWDVRVTLTSNSKPPRPNSTPNRRAGQQLRAYWLLAQTT